MRKKDLLACVTIAFSINSVKLISLDGESLLEVDKVQTVQSICVLLFVLSPVYAQDHPNYAGLPQSTATIIENPGFTIGYSEEHKNPIRVSYKLFHVEDPVKHERPSRFKVDDRAEAKVKHSDYTNNGYDRGHMAPNDAIMTCYGRDAQLSTFCMSNICPQMPKLHR